MFYFFCIFFALGFGVSEINVQLCTPKQRKRVRGKGKRESRRVVKLVIYVIGYVINLGQKVGLSWKSSLRY